MPLIGLDAPFQGTGSEGGSEHIVIGLVSGLARLRDGNEEYRILVPSNSNDWLLPFIGPNQKIVRWKAPLPTAGERIKRHLGRFRRPLGDLMRAAHLLERPDPFAVRPTPISDGFCESLGLDLLHLLYPLHFFKSVIPTILTVHDLQHRHFPEFFVWNDIPWREKLYPEALSHSKLVTAISWFVGNDTIRQYGISSDKLKVVPWASPTDCYGVLPEADCDQVVRKLRIPRRFILYPSVTYGHKNHIRLLEAIAFARDHRGIEIPVVCTGWKKLFWPKIEKRLRELKLERQVHFVGYVSASEIRALYRLCQFVVFPSLFEGCGLALLEAFREGKAVAASDIPPFHEYGLDAPVYFNPMNVEEMAHKIINLWCDDKRRNIAVQRSNELTRMYSWDKVAKTYRAIYRHTLGADLNEEDRRLLTQAALGPDSRALGDSAQEHFPLNQLSQ